MRTVSPCSFLGNRPEDTHGHHTSATRYRSPPARRVGRGKGSPCRHDPFDSRGPANPEPKQAVEITKNALKRIRVAMAKEGVSPEAGGLRLGVQGGGCSGLSYNIRFDTEPRQRDRVFLFGAGVETPNDPSGAKPVRLFVDPKSYLYLAGMVLDFEENADAPGL